MVADSLDGINMFSQSSKKTLQYSTGENFAPTNVIPFFRKPWPAIVGSWRQFAPQRDKLNHAIASHLPFKGGVQPIGIDPNVSAAFGKIFTNAGTVIKQKPQKY